MDARLRAQVRDRAGGRCEYCRIHEDEDPFFTFPIDHVIAQQHGGAFVSHFRTKSETQMDLS
jgi:hypothetical protein